MKALAVSLFLASLFGAAVLWVKLLGVLVDKGYISSDAYYSSTKQDVFGFVYMIGY